MLTAGGPDISWNGSCYQVAQGGEIRWTITAVHDDPNPATATLGIQDYVPKPADSPVVPFVFPTDVLGSSPAGDLTFDGSWLFDDNLIVPHLGTATLQFRTFVTATAPLGTVIWHLALVNYLVPPVPPNAATPTWSYTDDPLGQDAPTCVIVANDPNLATSTKTVTDANGNGVVEAGELLTYTITVRNTGVTSALNVVVTDTLPAGLVPGTIGQGGTLAGSTITWNSTTTPALATLRTGESSVLTFTATAGCVADGSTLCNQAFALADGLTLPAPTDDPSDPLLSSPTCLPTVAPEWTGSSLTMADASGDGRFRPGESMTLTINVRNRGSVAARNVEATLPVPGELQSVVPANGGVLSAGSIQWNSAGEPALASVAPGATVVLSATAVLDPTRAHGAVTCLQAAITSDAGCVNGRTNDPLTALVDDPTCVTALRPPSVFLALTTSDAAGTGTASPGDAVDFDLRLTWLDGEPLVDASVLFTLAPGAPFAGLAADEGGTVVLRTITWNRWTTPELRLVDGSASVLLHGHGILTCDARDAVPACASAEVTGANLLVPVPSDDPAVFGPANPSCVDVATPVITSTLSTTDADGDLLFEPGEIITFSLTVANSGTSAASDIAVTLPLLPEDLDVTATAGGIVSGAAITWDGSTTPALLSLATGANVVLGGTLRIDPASLGTRTCHQGSITWPALVGCAPVLTDDVAQAGPADPNCWDVSTNALPPAEVPDGNPLGAGPVPVTLACQGDDLIIRWSAAARATTHMVYRGPVDSFRSLPWSNPAGYINDPENAQASCDLLTLSYVDANECARGGANHYFLVAGRNLVGDGPLGSTFDGHIAVERPPVATPCP